jgi:hypothetical protein
MDWVHCSLFIILGIGLMKLYQWARVATIAAATLAVGAYGMFLFYCLRQWNLAVFLTAFLQFLLYLYILLYLSTSKVGLAFTAARSGISPDRA